MVPEYALQGILISCIFPMNEKGILPQQVTFGDLIALPFMVDPFLEQNQHSTVGTTKDGLADM
jgi:hypothetical protein